MKLIAQLRDRLQRDRMTSVALSQRLGLTKGFVSKCWTGEQRFNNGHLVTIMSIWPELTTYCYEYMIESGERINAKRAVLAVAS